MPGTKYQVIQLLRPEHRWGCRNRNLARTQTEKKFVILVLQAAVPLPWLVPLMQVSASPWKRASLLRFVVSQALSLSVSPQNSFLWNMRCVTARQQRRRGFIHHSTKPGSRHVDVPSQRRNLFKSSSHGTIANIIQVPRLFRTAT